MSPADPPPPPAMNHTLPIGTMVGGLQITGLIGEGGFGIVYLAFDTTLQRQVALKEYMPSALAARNVNSPDISVKSPKFVDTFNAGLRSFVNEARLLAHFDHPALVKVHQFWQANHTAYMVMPYYQGPTLKAHVATLRANGKRPDEAMLRGWLDPLLDALAAMHAEQCYHRDIAPDNILLTNKGPLLLDLGAARRVIGDMTQALTVILKPGYAPIEQYGDVATMMQGPWTDLYALASVLYYCITGHSPITSVERVMGDPLPRLSRTAAGQYSETFLGAVDAALAVRPADRPQSVAEFRALLDGRAKPRPPAEPQAVPVPPPPVVPPAYALDRTQVRPSAAQGGYAPTMAVPGVVPPTVTAPTGATSRRGGWIAALAGVVVAVVAVVVYLQRGVSQPPAPQDAAVAPAISPAMAPAAAPAASLPRAAEPAPAVATPAVAQTPAPAASAPAEVTATRVAAPVPPPVAKLARAAPAASAVARVPKPPPRPQPKPVETAARTAPAPVPPSATSTYTAPKPPPAETPVATANAAPANPEPVRPARCGELLKKGSQGLLTMDEAIYLRKECR